MMNELSCGHPGSALKCAVCSDLQSDRPALLRLVRAVEETEAIGPWAIDPFVKSALDALPESTREEARGG